MSLFQTQFKNTTNTAFSITYANGFYKLAFAAPISASIYLNAFVLYLSECPTNSNWVDIGQNDLGMVTVDWTLCTSPVAANRAAWILAVFNLSTSAIITGSLATGNYLTDTYVGYNQTTKQLTNLGTRVYFKATKANVQNFGAIAGLVPSTIVLYNVVIADTANGYNAATGRYTISQDGDYQVQYQVSTSLSESFSSIMVNGTAQQNFTNAARMFQSQIIPCVAGDIIDVRCNTIAGTASNLTVANDNFFVITRVFT